MASSSYFPIGGRPYIAGCVAFAVVTAVCWGRPVDFNADIRPILNQNCTACHGGVKAAGDISFVYRDAATKVGKMVWGGEFGRTPMRENRGGVEMKFMGRDHHPSAFTVWMAGGGVKPGISYGETAVGYSVAENPVEVRDLQATMVRLLGFDHHKLSAPFQGLQQRITGVKPTRIIRDIIA